MYYVNLPMKQWVISLSDIHLAIDDETISDDEWLEIEKAEQEIRDGKGIPGDMILKKFGIPDT